MAGKDQQATPVENSDDVYATKEDLAALDGKLDAVLQALQKQNERPAVVTTGQALGDETLGVVPGDYVEHGSEKHAQLLGLEKDEEGEWRLVDMTQFGPAATEDFLKSVLDQRVRELTTKPKVPANAPPLWRPDER